MLLTLIVAFLIALVCLPLSYLIHKITRKWVRKQWTNLVKYILLAQGLVAAGLASYLGFYWVLGDVDDAQIHIHQGVEYSRRVEDHGHYVSVVHVVEIDLNHPSLNAQFELSPPRINERGEPEHHAMDVSDALVNLGGDLAINASFFKPFKDNHLFDYYPRRGDWVSPIGPTYVHGVTYGTAASRWPVFLLRKDNSIDIYKNIKTLRAQEKDLKDIKGYFAAKSYLVKGGKNVATSPSYVYPRASIAIDKAKTRVWLVVVDGKQPGYSQGIELEKLADYLIRLGAETAIELDGGGSASMAARIDNHVAFLSRPAHTKIPNRARPIANHLVVKFGTGSQSP